ncbi:MAG TPA: CU044_5270 family protein [Streptomyces sp.]|nr:CU044_5270 family protein [Streptomyces sp.]
MTAPARPPYPTEPGLGDWTLPDDRRAALKRDLLRRIDEDAAPAPAGTRLRAPVARLRAGARAVRGPLVVLPAAALALTTTAVLLTAAPDDTPPRTTAAPRADAEAVVWLDRAATVASRRDVPPVRADQLVYVRSLVRDNTAAFGAPARLGPAHRREIWTVQDPGPVSRTGTLRETGPGAVMPGQYVPVEQATTTAPGDTTADASGNANGPDSTGAADERRGTKQTRADGIAPGVHRPTYAWLAALPTDPAALRALLREGVTPVDGQSTDHAVFDVIGELLHETVVPPPVAAALYRVAAGLPGVTVGGDAVDAAGRPGIGITYDDGRSATRTEWIFDRRTLACLGDRTYFTGRGDRPDVLFHTSAVLRRTAVDRLGETD